MVDYGGDLSAEDGRISAARYLLVRKLAPGFAPKREFDKERVREISKNDGKRTFLFFFFFLLELQAARSKCAHPE